MGGSLDADNNEWNLHDLALLVLLLDDEHEPRGDVGPAPEQNPLVLLPTDDPSLRSASSLATTSINGSRTLNCEEKHSRKRNGVNTDARAISDDAINHR